MLYNQALLTLTGFGTPDPFLVVAHGRCYLTYSCQDRVDILSSDKLIHLRTAHPTTIWRPPPSTRHSSGLWAPELHALHGRWYIYYAAEHPAEGNRSHRMYVLGGPAVANEPTVGPWEFLGLLRGLPEEQWAIDGTVFELRGINYFVYSGWPRGELESDLNQELFIIRLDSPIQARGSPVQISRPKERWERTQDQGGDHGINEGPQWLAKPDGDWCGLVYSCAGSWTSEYKMAVLHFQGGDPLNPGAWRKDTKPLLQSKREGLGPYGPGHGNFATVGGQVLGIFHATDNATDGWANRRARTQRVAWTTHGPYMGDFVGSEVPEAIDFAREVENDNPFMQFLCG